MDEQVKEYESNPNFRRAERKAGQRCSIKYEKK